MYGAEIVLTDGTKGMDGAIKMAQEIAKNTPDSFIPDQFCNPSNPLMHKMTTGPEIWKDTDGSYVRIFSRFPEIRFYGKYTLFFFYQNASLSFGNVTPHSRLSSSIIRMMRKVSRWGI